MACGDPHWPVADRASPPRHWQGGGHWLTTGGAHPRCAAHVPASGVAVSVVAVGVGGLPPLRPLQAAAGRASGAGVPVDVASRGCSLFGQRWCCLPHTLGRGAPRPRRTAPIHYGGDGSQPPAARHHHSCFRQYTLRRLVPRADRAAVPCLPWDGLACAAQAHPPPAAPPPCPAAIDGARNRLPTTTTCPPSPPRAPTVGRGAMTCAGNRHDTAGGARASGGPCSSSGTCPPPPQASLWWQPPRP